MLNFLLNWSLKTYPRASSNNIKVLGAFLTALSSPLASSGSHPFTHQKQIFAFVFIFIQKDLFS